MTEYKIKCENYSINGTSFVFNGERVKIDYVQPTQEQIDSGENPNEVYAKFYIKCDDENDINSFNYEYYGDDEMVIEKNRCTLEVYIKENKTPYNKYFTIKCTHANDSSVYVQIDIIQVAEEYKLELSGEGLVKITETSTENENESQETSDDAEPNKEKVECIQYEYSKLNSVIQSKNDATSADMNYNYFETFDMTVNVVGGSKKYNIETIMRCHEDGEGDDKTISYLPFDNGFIYNKFDNELQIINYGRPFLDEKDYYLIRMCHKDFKWKKVEVKLSYQAEQATTTTNSSPRNTRKKKIKSQVSAIYMPYDEFMQQIEEQNETETINNAVNCEIRFNPPLESEYVVIGQRNDIELPFKVYEDNEESNLMVKTYSSGNWCSVVTDDTNRKLKIKIKNKPIIERKSFVKISIIDHPETFLAFVLINRN